ncbi:MAG: hypothetical protein ACPGNV_06840 [Mangrovicoccus sp.]
MSADTTLPRRNLWAERVAYSNGMLLDQADFEVDQSYHRERISMLARYLHGTGTVAGLEVALDATDARRLVIAPGLGIDRAGRMLQSPLPLCLNLDRWYADQIEDQPSGVLSGAFRVGSNGDPDHILADIFLGFRECETAKRPAFQAGAFDALGALAPLRLRDAVEATLVLRGEASPGLPDRSLAVLTGATPAERRADLDAQKRSSGWVEDALWDDFDSAIRRGPEHPSDDLAADIFLARLMLPATQGTGNAPPDLNPALPVAIDNAARAMVYSAADLIALAQS